jgi:hypothetical protein
MSEAARFWGAHAPRVLRLAPSPIALPKDRNFGEGAEKCTRGRVRSPIPHEFQT